MKKITKNWRNAATLILAAKNVGSSSNSYKILMLRRSSKSKFMPNAYVFPGGVSNKIDFTEEWKDIFQTHTNNTNSVLEQYKKKFTHKKRPFIYTNNDQEGLLPPEIAFRICAIRETFEESGILLVSDRFGQHKILDDPSQEIGGRFGTLKEWRDQINKNEKHFIDLFRETKTMPNIQSLIDWSTWLTPTFPQSKRFDTLFYIVFLHEIPSHGGDCGVETSAIDWFHTSETRNMYRYLPPPQQYEFLRFERTSNCVPDISLLHDWSTWLTPTFHEIRFNTIFYVCFVNNIQSQVADNQEVTHSDWYTPKKCLSDFEEKKILLRIPQLYEYSRISRYKTFDDFKSFAEEREAHGLDLWCPFKIVLKDGFIITYPGDDYHVDDCNMESYTLNETIEENRLKTASLNRAESCTDGTMNLLNNVDWFGHPALGNVNLMKSKIER